MFPLLYQAHYNLHQEDLPFWSDLAAQARGPVLELGCGSGRVLLHLVEAGYRAFGLDRNRESLFLLVQTLSPSLKARVSVFQGDMAAFHLDLALGLILLPCNTFSTLSASGRLSTLDRVYMHLRPGGIFAASLPNPIQLKKMPRQADPEIEENFPHPVDGEPVQVSSAWKRTDREFQLTWIYDHLLPDGRVERHSAQVCHSLAGPETYLEELRQVGFEELNLFGDFDNSPFEIDSPNLILVASKK